MAEILSLEQLEKLIGHPAGLADFVEPLNQAFIKYEINTNYRIAAFLSQVAVESGGFKLLEENLHYSAAQLLRVFPTHFNAANVAQYAGKPEAIANRAYANRYGNGDEASGDGYRYRGRGLIQITFKNNYRDFLTSIGKTVDDHDYLLTKEGAVISAAWYWNSRHLNLVADKDDIKAVTRIVNGGYNGLPQREAYYKTALQLFT